MFIEKLRHSMQTIKKVIFNKLMRKLKNMRRFALSCKGLARF